MHPIIKAFLVLFVFIMTGSGISYAIFYIYTREIYEVRIPKMLRIGPFKNYISPEEKAEI